MDQTPETATHNKPEAEVKSGAVVGVIWKNEGPTGPYRTVALTRFYKDRDGKWQRTKTLRPKNMPDMATVAGLVTEKIAELASEPETTGTDAQPATPSQTKAPRGRKAKPA